MTDQRRVNVYYDIRQDEENSKVAVYGLPGTLPFATIGLTPSRGFYVIGLTMYVVLGANLWSVTTAGGATNIGTLLTNAGFVDMADNGVQLMIVDSQAGYIYTLVGQTYSIGFVPAGNFAQIVSANFPNGASSVGFNTGFFLVNKPNTGQFWKSGSYDGTSWLGTDFATAEANPDLLSRVFVDQGFVFLFGTASIEYWQNTGVQGFPFAPATGATQEIGLGATFSVAKWNNSVAFLATNLQGGYQIYASTPGAVQKISTTDIDAIIAGFVNPADAVGMSYVVDGHPMYQINFQRDARSFLYDGTTGIWSEVISGVQLSGRHICNQAIAFNGKVYASDYSVGNIYQLDENTFTDNSAPIMRLIQTRSIHDNGNMIGIDELVLSMETGVGVVTGQGSNPVVMVSVSKDGGRTFGNERWMGIGRLGQYLLRATLRRFGASRQFCFRFRMTDPVKFAVSYGSATIRGMGK